MEIWESQKLILFIAFVVPGFIGLKTYELLHPCEIKESSQRIVDAVIFSSINYALLVWPIYEMEVQKISLSYPKFYILFCFFVLFIAPILWANLLSKMRLLKFFKGKLPHPTSKPWDFVFSKCHTYFVIVTLSTNEKIAGLYGLKSFTSNAPSIEQIYLEQTWVLNEDGGFERPQNETAGVIILASDITKVELFNIT